MLNVFALIWMSIATPHKKQTTNSIGGYMYMYLLLIKTRITKLWFAMIHYQYW